MKLKTPLIFLIIFGLFVLSAIAQKRPNKKSVLKPSETKQKKQSVTISGGVVNGKAISLIVPVYPKAAKMLNVYGQVKVQVLIDTDGNVKTAEVISGNPLLQNTCIAAALRSKFMPIKIGGEFVRVSGIIHYNFIPANWNWLEIGYILEMSSSNYYFTNDLTKYLPDGFEAEIQLLEQNAENKIEIKKTVIASVQNKLFNNQRSAWLFSIGLALGKIKKNCCKMDELFAEDLQNLRTFIHTKPEGISQVLVFKLEKFILLVDNQAPDSYNSNSVNEIPTILRDLEQNFPILGK